MASDQPEEESEELRAFRERWRAEVKHKQQHQRQYQGEQPGPEPTAGHPLPPAVPTASSGELVGSPRQKPAASQSRPAHVSRPSDELSQVRSTPRRHARAGDLQHETQFQAAQRRALEIYRDAARHEQASDLDLALRLYRQAFRLDPDVDKAYHRAEGLAFYSGAAPPALATPGTPEAPPTPSSPSNPHVHAKGKPETHVRKASADKISVDVITSRMGTVRVSAGTGAHQSHIDRTISGVLATLVKEFPSILQFSPEIETEPVAIELLPYELLVLVISFLDPNAIERFASASKKARVVTLDSSIWRPFVEGIYKSPQILEDEAVGDVLKLYDGDYRRTYIEHPRVRLDGVYISVNQYVRGGYSENRWVNVSHLITYHRYLRFYPSGQVISLLANEDQEPQQVISMLKPSLRMKGFNIGTWRLEGTTVYISNLEDPMTPDARYTFQMTLQLRSRPTGRWNRLDFGDYESVNVGDGEVLALPLKNERPFWFSKVRSYAHA